MSSIKLFVMGALLLRLFFNKGGYINLTMKVWGEKSSKQNQILPREGEMYQQFDFKRWVIKYSTNIYIYTVQHSVVKTVLLFPKLCYKILIKHGRIITLIHL